MHKAPLQKLKGSAAVDRATRIELLLFRPGYVLFGDMRALVASGPDGGGLAGEGFGARRLQSELRGGRGVLGGGWAKVVVCFKKSERIKILTGNGATRVMFDEAQVEVVLRGISGIAIERGERF